MADSSARPSAEGATLYQPRPTPDFLRSRRFGNGLGWYSVAPSALGLTEESSVASQEIFNFDRSDFLRPCGTPLRQTRKPNILQAFPTSTIGCVAPHFLFVL